MVNIVILPIKKTSVSYAKNIRDSIIHFGSEFHIRHFEPRSFVIWHQPIYIPPKYDLMSQQDYDVSISLQCNMYFSSSNNCILHHSM